MESAAEFEPPPPTVTGLETVVPPAPADEPAVTGPGAVAGGPDAPAEADGDELIGLDWTVPVEPLDVLPPPACTTPTELVAVLSPVPAIDVGAETPAVAPDWLAPAEGVTPTFPVCTAPTEPVALLSASAVCAVPNVSATTVAATSKHLALMSPSFLSLAAG